MLESHLIVVTRSQVVASIFRRQFPGHAIDITNCWSRMGSLGVADWRDVDLIVLDARAIVSTIDNVIAFNRSAVRPPATVLIDDPDSLTRAQLARLSVDGSVGIDADIAELLRTCERVSRSHGVRRLIADLLSRADPPSPVLEAYFVASGSGGSSTIGGRCKRLGINERTLRRAWRRVAGPDVKLADFLSATASAHGWSEN